MSLGEFELIDRYFSASLDRKDVVLGTGDDCAIVQVPDNKQLVITTDTLVNDVHFRASASPEDIAYKSVAVNLSDLASMGAEPAWAMLSITLPEINEDWLARFASSFNSTISDYNVQLIGGDTTHGPLSITVQAMGLIAAGAAMRRDTAMPGDAVYVTGTVGDAAAGLSLLQNNAAAGTNSDWLINRLNRPEPRVEFGIKAARHCRCAIDISDGLAADLGHVLEASHCGASIELGNIPLSQQLVGYFDSPDAVDWLTVLTGGDDYELCLVVPPDKEQRLVDAAHESSLDITRIGNIRKQPGVVFLRPDGSELSLQKSGYEHF